VPDRNGDHASTFFSLCSDVLLVIDERRNIERANPAALDKLGFAAGELEGQPFSSLVHDDDKDIAEAALTGSQRQTDFVCRVRLASGDPRSFRFRAYRGDETPFLYLIGTASERPSHEQQLRDSEERARALFDNAAQAIISIDRAGRIQTANPMSMRIFGYEESELLGTNVEALLPRSDRTAHKQHRSNYFDNPRSRPMGHGLELMGRRKDGVEFPVEISLSHISTELGPAAVAFINDISERKRAQLDKQKLEHRLEHATKMEAVGRLAGGIAHDFNNLLTALSGFAEIALDELPADHPLYEGATETYKTCQRSTSLVRRLLAVSRRQMLQPQLIDVNAKIVDLEKMLDGLLGEDIELQIKLADESLWIRADESQMEQVLLNLIVNSRDAMPTGGTLSVQTKAVDIDDAVVEHNVGIHPGPHVLLTISDTGEGMDESTLARIFEPFFTTKEKGKGTGLGLATVYGIVQQTKGNIWAYSEPGQGATFKVYLPRADSKRFESPAERPASSGVSGDETILVVEDENTVRLVTVTHLRNMGYDVLAARDGIEALEMARDHDGPIALLLTDVIMPRMNGPLLRAKLTEQFPEIEAIYMSGHADDALAQHGILEEGRPFIEKPFTRETLGRSVREVLDRARDGE